MTSETMAGGHERARIQVKVYRTSDGFRWRIKSPARGQRIVADSGQGYSHKGDAGRGLLLATGGRYVSEVHFRAHDGSAYEQGVIVRGIEGGLVEEIFVQYSSRLATA